VAGIDLGKKSGAVSLTKGARVTIEKTQVIRASASWSSKTDYDLYALVELTDGTVLTCATFGTKDDPQATPSVLGGAVRHLGDVGRVTDGTAQEVIEVKLDERIRAVYPVAYSAQSNGTGSFRKYKVSTGIDNGAGTTVSIEAEKASRNPLVYTVVIGAIRNGPEGVVIEALEEYSRMGSENRPLVQDGELRMNAGPVNATK
jgi:tellurite resistance protein TerA